jgi:hypothetical protein
MWIPKASILKSVSATVILLSMLTELLPQRATLSVVEKTFTVGLILKEK